MKIDPYQVICYTLNIPSLVCGIVAAVCVDCVDMKSMMFVVVVDYVVPPAEVVDTAVVVDTVEVVDTAVVVDAVVIDNTAAVVDAVVDTVVDTVAGAGAVVEILLLI